MGENPRLEDGFRCARIPEIPDYAYPKADPYTMEVLKSSEFRTWDDFPRLISSTRSDLNRQLYRQGCRPNNQRQDRCAGAFQNTECGDYACRLVAEYKDKAGRLSSSSSSKKLEELFKTHLLRGLVHLAEKIESNWDGELCYRSPLQLDSRFSGGETTCVRPVFSIRRDHNRISDVVIMVWPPARGHLLPPLKSGRRTFSNLAAAYQHDCPSITDTSRIPYHVKRMGSVAKAALLSKSGYGCMCTHNQAVFVKVVVKKTSLGAPPKHIVFVSEEYKCDSRNGSVFDGLLTLMIRGFKDASSGKQQQLHHHFSQVIYQTPSLPHRDEGSASGSHKP